MKPEVLLAVLVCVVIAGSAVFMVRNMVRRTDALTAFAAQQGWSLRHNDYQLTAQLRGEPFERGVQPFATQILDGTYRGLPVRVFSFDYKQSTLLPHGANDAARTGRSHFTYAIASVLLPFVWPTVQAKPEGVLTELRAAFGMRDLQLGNPAFDQRFHLSARDPHAADGLFSPAMQQWMLTEPRFAQCPFRVSGNEILTWWPGHLQAEMIFPMLDFCLDVVAQLPANARQSPAPNPLVQWRIAEGAGNDAS